MQKPRFGKASKCLSHLDNNDRGVSSTWRREKTKQQLENLQAAVLQVQQSLAQMQEELLKITRPQSTAASTPTDFSASSQTSGAGAQLSSQSAATAQAAPASTQPIPLAQPVPTARLWNAPARWLRLLWNRKESPFVLWFLSTIVVGLIAWGYKELDDYYQKKHEREDRRQKIIQEVHFRIHSSQVHDKTIDNTRNTLGGLSDYSLYPEFQKVPLAGLLLRLIPLCDSKQKEEIKRLMTDYERLPRSGGNDELLRSYRGFMGEAREMTEPLLPK